MRSTTIIIATILIITAFANAEAIRVPLSYSSSDFEITRKDFTKIYLKNGVVCGNPGEPQIPSEALHILLPPDAMLTSARIESQVWEPLVYGMPFPAQPPAIFSIGPLNTVAPDPGIYNQNRWFPEKPILAASGGNLSGYRLAGVCVAPVRWNPALSLGEMLVSGQLVVEFERDHTAPKVPARRSRNGEKIWRSAIEHLIENPENLKLYSFTIDPNAYDWAVFAPASYVPNLLNLPWIRKSWGLRDTTISLETVYSTYSGANNAEKLRNAITDLYANSGVSFVLIIGDYAIAPHRKAFAMDCEAGIYDDENDIPTDLYFSDLDGNWNFDSDAIYGEIEDSVDLYPDVMVGRFSVTNTTQLMDLISKIETYETIPGGNFPESGLMLAQVLWKNPFTDGADFKDDLIENVFPDYFTFGRVYESDGGSREKALDSLDTGPNLINHDGHAAYVAICVDSINCISRGDMDQLSNADRPSVLFSIGCWPAAFDKDCIAEHYVNNSSGGGVAFIGNSRYGWGSPGNSGWGYSDILDRAFWQEVFTGHEQLGAALAVAKARYIPYARWENVWRWVIYELNVLGDPATAAITGDTPINLTYEIEGVDANVKVSKDGDPGTGSIVSAFDNYGLLDVGTADASGFVSLSLEGASAPIYLTARLGSEGFAAETLTTPTSNGFFRYWYAYEYGYSDSTAEPGDTIKASFLMGDFDSALTAITWNPITIYDPPLSLINPPSSLAAGDSAEFSATFYIPEDIRPDTTFVISPNVSHSGGNIGYPVSLPINRANLEFIRGLLVDSDSSLEPGEVARLQLLWTNTGDGTARGGNATVTCPGGELNITGSPMSLSDIHPGDTTYIGPFEVSWSAPSEQTPIVELVISAGTSTDTLFFVTTNLGFQHNAESSDAPFQKSVGSLWHRSTRRPYSGNRGWWCGNPVSSGYLSNLDDSLYTDRMVIGAGMELSFRAFMSFPNYGSDGLHIIAVGDEDTVELDYLGSGGALLSFIVGWCEYTYKFDNTPFSPGDSVGILFRFTSDNSDEEEGVFLDDIELACTQSEFTVNVRETTRRPDKLSIIAYPNPFNSTITIEISGDIPRTPEAKTQIYDLSGRRIREMGISNTNRIIWDGLDANGDDCPSGTYFVRFVAPGRVATTRAILIK